MGLFDFFSGGGRSRPPQRRPAAKSAAAQKADHAALIKAERAAEAAAVTAAVAQFRTDGSTFPAFLAMVNELLRFHKCPGLPVQATPSMFAQTDDVIAIVELVLCLREDFPGIPELDDASMMQLSVVQLARHCGVAAPASAPAAAATPNAGNQQRARYPVGPRTLQSQDGVLAAVFGAFRKDGARLPNFVTLVRSLMRGAGATALPADPGVPILQQSSDPAALENLLFVLKDEFAALPDFDEKQRKRLTIRDLAQRCKINPN